jgi:hypothetical protein
MRSTVLFTLLMSAARASVETSAWRVSEGQVHVTCPLTAGGSFEATTHSITGRLSERRSPQTFEGSIEVDLRDLDSGIALRDEHMRDSYLETGRGEGFDKAILADIRVGNADPRTFKGQTTFAGVLSLHGTKHPVQGQARVRRRGTSAQIEATLPIRLSDYNIPKPQYLGVGVKEEVQVRVSFLAVLEPATGGEP